MIRFNCPSCGMKLKADDEYAASSINCPGCNTKLQVPASLAAREAEATTTEGGAVAEEEPEGERSGWVETDPANPNIWVALGLGLGIMVAILLAGWVCKKPLPYVYGILYQRGWVNFAETFVFSWGIGILILKLRKLQHQRNALLLDVLPSHLGKEINRDNVQIFIAHVYGLPVHLRDSLMVNRIRKGLELFHTRQVNADVANMMTNQSNIDSVRISGSFALLKAFVWVIPILGFVGTVLGLSAAIGNFESVMGGAKDVDALMSSLSGVTGGLATAFDTTLLGLIYSIILSIPMSALQKVEDDNLNTIDAYCNEILLPRLNDGANVAGGDMGGFLGTLTQALGQAQGQFLSGLNTASGLIKDQSENLERRAREHQAVVEQTFSRTVTNLQKDTAQSMENMMNTVSHTLAGLEAGIHSVNKALKELGERQIIIQQKPGFFARLFGKG